MSLESRRDNRTEEEFARDINAWTWAEGCIARLVMKDMKMRGADLIRIENTGVDNSGRLIRGSLKSNESDFNFIFGFGTVPTEVKVANPKEWKFQTLKTNDIRKAANKKGCILCYSEEWYYIIKPETCRFLLDNFLSKIYKTFSPDDQAIRIHSKYYGAIHNMTDEERGPKLWEEFLEDGTIRKVHWKSKALRATAAEVIKEANKRKSQSRS